MRRKNFNRCLIGFDDDEILILLNRVADGFEPLTNFNLGDRFANLGDLNSMKASARYWFPKAAASSSVCC